MRRNHRGSCHCGRVFFKLDAEIGGAIDCNSPLCRHCGIHPFARPRLDPSRWVVNLRCIDGIDLTALRVHSFDGEHRENAAAA